MKVHGAVLSTASQRVFACLYEKELDFELVPVDMRTGGHKKEPFISLNPFGQVPAFEDGDLKLFAGLEPNGTSSLLPKEDERSIIVRSASAWYGG